MTYAIATLTIFSLLSALRVLIGPTLWDRLLGLNLVTSKLIVIIILIAFIRNESFLLDMALVYALLSFIGIIFISIYIQRKGRF
jgi:multicomponent Na+:H+ antiporter subunit F